MDIAVLSEIYPSDEHPVERAFVHARVRLYQRMGHTVRVFAEGAPCAVEDDFEGISVWRGDNATLTRIIHDLSPDVLAIHTPYSGTATFCLATDLSQTYPVVAWIHGYEAMYTAFQGYHRGWQRWASIPWDARKLRGLHRFLQTCAGVVYVSRWLQGLAERGVHYRHPHSHVVHNPVDTQIFRPETASDSDRPHLVTKGIAIQGLRRIYGLDIVTETFTALDRTELTILGTGPLEDELRAQIQRTRSKTTLLAHGVPHAQIPALLNRYDYFVAPSRNETQGVAMCEAMACGLPVVATRVGGIPEFVRDGIDGYLVPAEDPKALRAAIQTLVGDQEHMRTMGRNARQHMVELCDARLIAGQELAILAAAVEQAL